MKRKIGLSLLGIFLATGVAAAQTATPPTTSQSTTTTQSVTTTSDKGTFDKLSPGDQKIAQALYDAQTSKKLSRDDITSMKKDGQGWGEVFKQMKSQGLVQEKNLGEVVSRSSRPSGSVGNSGATTNETGRGNGFGRGGGVSGGQGHGGGRGK